MPTEEWAIEYDRWWDDHDCTKELVCGFTSRAEAETWAQQAWSPLYQPSWRPRRMRRRWEGTVRADEESDGRVLR